MSQSEPSVRRNTVYSFAAQFLPALFSLAITLFLVRELATTAFGVFALALSISSLFLLPSDLGVGVSAARFVAERRGDLPAIRDILAAALRPKLAIASLVAVTMLVSAGPIADAYHEPTLAWPLRALAFGTLGSSFMGFYRAVLVAHGLIPRSFWILIGESAVELAATVALVLSVGGASAAAWGRAAGYVFAALLAALTIGRWLGRGSLSPRRRAHVPNLMSYALSMFVMDAAWTMFTYQDVLLIGAFLGSASVAVFSAPLRFLIVLSYPAVALASALTPRLARPDSGRSDVERYAQGLRYLVIYQGLTLVPALVWTTPLVHLLLGGGYHHSVTVVRALAPFVYLGGLGPYIASGVHFLGDPRRRVPIAVVTVLIAFVLDLILIPRIGVVGAAISTDVGFALYVPAHLVLAHRDVALPLRKLALTLARTVVAAVAAGATLAAFGTVHLSAAAWVGGSLAAVVVYGLALAATGEIGLGELRALRRSSPAVR